MAIIVVGDKPLEMWQEFVVESLEKVEQDEVEAVGVFLLLKGGGMALQEMIDGEGKEE